MKKPKIELQNRSKINCKRVRIANDDDDDTHTDTHTHRYIARACLFPGSTNKEWEREADK